MATTPTVKLPSFRFSFPEPGLNDPPGGAIAASSAGSALSNLSKRATASVSQRQQLDALASFFDDSNPEIAAMLRTQASSIPLFGTGGSTGGGGGASGGLGGSTGDILTFALRQAEGARRQKERIAFEDLQQGNALERIGATFKAQVGVAEKRAELEENLAKLKDNLDETVSDPEAKKILERQLKLSEINAETQQAFAENQITSNAIDAVVEANQIEARRASGLSQKYTINPATGQVEVLPPTVASPRAGQRLPIPGVKIEDDVTGTKRSPTHQELKDLYLNFKTPSTQKLNILGNVVNFLQEQGRLKPAPSFLTDQEKEIYNENSLKIAKEFILSDFSGSPASNQSTTTDYSRALRGFIEEGKESLRNASQ